MFELKKSDFGADIFYLEGRSRPKLKRFPESQLEGQAWVVDVLNDLIEFCDYRGLGASSKQLKIARSTTLNEITEAEDAVEVLHKDGR